MKKPILPSMLSALFLVLTLTAAPFGIAGPHGDFGGGGFHGGGWGDGYHGGWGGYNGGWHGGYWGHNGYWHGGYWGYGGWGWGVGISFAWGNYWPAYPYYYVYPPAWAPACSVYYPCYPYYPYPYYISSGDPQPVNTYVRVSAASERQAAHSDVYDVDATSDEETVAQPRVAGPSTPAPTSSVSVRNASYRPSTSSYTATVGYSPTSRPRPQINDLRPEVRNVIRALHNMPPAARQRQIASGRYSNLSAQELEWVRYAAGVPGE